MAFFLKPLAGDFCFQAEIETSFLKRKTKTGEMKLVALWKGRF
jgi:hypothetical protein